MKVWGPGAPGYVKTLRGRGELARFLREARPVGRTSKVTGDLFSSGPAWTVRQWRGKLVRVGEYQQNRYAVHVVDPEDLDNPRF